MLLWELLAVAARAALQWALATLLLANGAAFCLIAACSERLRLGPPCILCARVHRLLSASGDGRDALRLLLCDAHLAATGSEEQARLGPGGRSGEESNQGLEIDRRDKVSSGLETHRVVSIGSEICEQDNASDAGRAGAGGTDDGSLVSLFELAPIVAHQRDDGEHKAMFSSATPELLGVVDGGSGERLTVGQLLSLRAQRRELDALRAELEAERSARAAAEEYQRQLEEQGELDREAARLAMELVHETEREKRALQQQLEACRVRAQLYGRGGQQLAGEEGCGGGGDDNNYQSLVDFLPGSVYSSSPDLANLMKLYDEGSAGNGDRRQREGYAPAVTAVAEDVEEEEEVAVVAAVTAGSVNVDGTAAITTDDSIMYEKDASCQVTEASRLTHRSRVSIIRDQETEHVNTHTTFSPNYHM